jgi:hypothetical protein
MLRAYSTIIASSSAAAKMIGAASCIVNRSAVFGRRIAKGYYQKPPRGSFPSSDTAASISLSSRVRHSNTVTFLAAAALADAIKDGAYGAVAGLYMMPIRLRSGEEGPEPASATQQQRPGGYVARLYQRAHAFRNSATS